MNLILTGLRGTGKTTIGQLLAAKSKRPFLDTDSEIQTAQGQTISQIVAKHGWDYFRDLEHELLKKINAAHFDNYIISTGGGTLIFDRNYKFFKNNRVIILLTCDLAKITQRLADSENRPSLINGQNFLDELKQIWQKRQKKYAKIADLTIDTTDKTPWQIANELTAAILLGK